MTWWEAMLATLGVIGFWPALLVVGDRADAWWQGRQAALLRRTGEAPRTVGGE